MTIAALAMMTVTACGGEDRAATVELPPSPTPEIESTGSTAESSAPAERSAGDGADVTVDQLIAALPTVEDLPTGWTVETAPAAVPTEDNSTVSPPECGVLFDGLRETGGTREATVTATYSAGRASAKSVLWVVELRV